MPASNGQIIALASAERTASNNSIDFGNNSARGAHIVIDVTAVTSTPSITVTVQGKDEASGKYYTILASAAISTVSTNKLIVYPGAAATANESVPDVLPKKWRISVTHGDSDAITYSVGVNLVV